jgi:hypothetical protein
MLPSNTFTPATSATPDLEAVAPSPATVCIHIPDIFHQSGLLTFSGITNLTVTLSEADTGFADVMSLDSVTDKNFKSTDGGITWHADWIKVSSINFDSSDDTEVDY